MATTGEKFMRLCKAVTLTITSHAMDRMAKPLGWNPTPSLAAAFFRGSRYVKPDQLYRLGYRPAYGRRQRAGERTWYFLFRVFGQELVAVVGKGDGPGEYVWVTTYAPDAQTDHFRLGEPEAVLAA